MMTEINQHKTVNLVLAPSEVLEQRASWMLLCLVVLFAQWISGASLMQSFIVSGIAVAPVVIQIFAARFNDETSHELEMAAWIVVAVIGATAMGGAISPLSVVFFIPVVTALSLGLKRQAIESSAFSVLGFCLAALLSRMKFLPLEQGVLDPAPSLFALISLIYMASLVRKIQLGSETNFLLKRVRSQANAQLEKLGKKSDMLLERLKKSQSEAKLAKEELDIEKSKFADLDEKFAQRALFFAKTSHELRTPLNAILGFSEIMKEGVFGELPEKYKEYAKMIHEGGQSLQLTVDDVLNLSKIEVGEYKISPEVISLSEIVWDSVRFMSDQAKRAEVRLGIGSRGEDIEAFADARAVKQIVQNLISNAIKFTPKGGSVAIAVRSDDDGGAWLSVRDTGPGIDPAVFDDILKPFIQTETAAKSKIVGTGLGLSVVNGFIKLHNGRLTLDSEPGEGSVISAYFPPNSSAN